MTATDNFNWFNIVNRPVYHRSYAPRRTLYNKRFPLFTLRRPRGERDFMYIHGGWVKIDGDLQRYLRPTGLIRPNTMNDPAHRRQPYVTSNAYEYRVYTGSTTGKKRKRFVCDDQIGLLTTSRLSSIRCRR